MQGIQPRWKYIWPYLVFFATIIYLVFYNISISDKLIEKHAHYGYVLNIAGRQRLRSQKLVTLMLAHKTRVYNKDFTTILHEWDSLHHWLGHNQSIALLDTPHSTVIVSLFDSLAPVQKSLYEKLSLYDHKVPLSPAQEDSIVQLQALYLKYQDPIVDNISEGGDQSILTIREGQASAYLFSGALLILEILLMVVPNHRKLILAYRQAKEQKQKTQNQKEEILAQNELLAASNRKLEELNRTEDLTLKAINAGIWTRFFVTGKENWSDKFYSLLGYTPGEIPASFDTFMSQLIHPDDKEKLAQAIEQHLAHNTPYKLNVRIRNKNGEYYWYETTGQAYKDLSGQPIQMAGSIIDIQDKIVYQTGLEEMNSMKSRLVTILAHDLKSPIASAISLLDLVQNDLVSREEFTEYIALTKEKMTLISDALDNALKWALLQLKESKMNPAVVDVCPVLNEVLTLYSALYERKNISITKLYDGHGCMAYIDKDHLSVVFRNLLNNAIKFTPEGGNIRLQVSHTATHTYIFIKDSGVGMEPEMLDALLLRGQSSSGIGTNGEKGTGLGIRLCLELLAKNSGSLDATSEPGKGTTFTIALLRQAPVSA